MPRGVARGRDPGCSWTRGPGETLEQIRPELRFHPATLSRWIRQADIDDGVKPGVTRDRAAKLREARRLIRRMEQENEVLRHGI